MYHYPHAEKIYSIYGVNEMLDNNFTLGSLFIRDKY